MEPEIEERWLEIDGVQLCCYCAGKHGSPVMLLHGGGPDMAMLSYLLAIPFLAREHRVFAMDWPGYGESARPAIRHTTQYLADTLGRVLDALGLERASLAGLSMGGGASLSFALQHPERVERLVLADSYGFMGSRPLAKLGYVILHIPGLWRLVWTRLARNRDLLRRRLPFVVYDPAPITEEDLRVIQVHMLRPHAWQPFGSWLRDELRWGGFRTDLRGQLPHLAAPTLFIHGEEDHTIPVHWAKEAAPLVPNARLHVLPRCGHWSPREKAAEFNQLVRDFLAEAVA